jgi:acetolactate synthase I/II/III large subunit
VENRRSLAALRAARRGADASGYSSATNSEGRLAALRGPTMSETSGGEVLARMLQAEGVEKVFGIIDGTYFGFYSSLHRLGIEIVTPRHETCAAHMAGAYARLTGKLGVCMASNGPGVANILPGLAVENAEDNRVLAITSCRRP